MKGSSADLTGSGSLGGDWVLEYSAGAIDAALAVSADPQSWSGILATVAPVLSGANNLTTISEDAASNGGTSVVDLIAGKVTDADPGAVTGIAVTAVDNTHGAWQYSTN